MKLILKMLRYAKPVRLSIIMATFFGVLGNLFIAAIPITSYYLIINNVSNTVFLIFLFGVIFAFLRGLSRYIEQWLNHYVAFKILRVLRVDIFKKLEELAPSKLLDKQSGVLVNMVIGDIESLEAFYAHTISPILIASVYSIVILSFFSFINPFLLPSLALLIISFCIITPLLTYRTNKTYGLLEKETLGRLKQLSYEVINGYISIKNNHLNDYYEKENSNAYKILQQNTKKTKLNYAFINIFNNSLLIFALILALLFVNLDFISMNEFILFCIFSLTSIAPYKACANLGNMLILALSSAKRIFDLYDESPLIKDTVTCLDESFASLTFRNIYFNYPNNIKNVIKNLNFTLTKGQILGIKGPSGSGKTTILSLLIKAYSPTNGDILYNQTNYTQIGSIDIRNKIAYLQQEAVIYEDTFLNNLTLNNPEFSNEQIHKVLKLVNLEEFVNSLEQKLDTKITKNSLSNGQKQRLSIARAVLYDREILLLDEPTANLDILNENIILEALLSLKKTIIIVSHLETTLKICDTIIELDKSAI